jgi:hypothetical protein
MARVIKMIWGEWEGKYFCGGDWTGRNSLIRLKKFGCARTWFRQGGAAENPASHLPKPIECSVTVILIWIGQRPNSKFAFGGGNGVQPFALLFEPDKAPKSRPAKRS